MNSEIIPITEANPQSLTRPAQTDEHMIDLWLHGRSAHTHRAYRADADRFFAFIGKSLHEVTLGDLQVFADLLDVGLKPASKHRRLSAIKSLFAFAHRIGYLQFDVAGPLRLPALRNQIAERILTEAEVQRMLALEHQPRNHALLYLLYATGMRVSECCALKWRDLQERAESGQVTVFGKGGKTNAILLPASVWAMILSLRGSTPENAPVFRSRRGAHLHPTQLGRIVRIAAKRAGIKKQVSPHWLRHGHASHALDRGAPIHLVQSTLGHSSVATTSRYLHSRPADSSSRFLAL